MTSTEREYLQRLERRIHDLERSRFPRGSLVVIPLVAVTLLSAWAPTTGPAVVESRLAALESLIGPGPEGSVQARTPFQVLDGQGKVIFNVGGRDAAGAVNVTTVGGSNAALRVLGTGGKDAANMVVDAGGNGRISNFDASGNVVSQFNSVGLNVYNTDASAVAGVTRGGGTGRIAVWREGKTAAEITGDAAGNGTVSTYAKGKEVVSIGSIRTGDGNVEVKDADGKASAALNQAGLNVYSTEGLRVAGVTRGLDGRGRVVVWHDNDKTSVQLSADKQGNGRLLSYGANGKIRIDLNGDGGAVTVMDDAENGVVSMLNRNGQGVVGVKASVNNRLTAEMTVDSGGGGILHMKAPDGKTAIGLYAARRVIALGNSQGSTVAEMVVNPAGFGLFQVWAGQGKMPLAVLGKSADNFGGILQISNGQSIISSLTVSPGGNGMWQLNDATGKPVIEAGSIGPVGTIRVGPSMRCLPRPSSLVLPDCLLGRAK